MINKISQNVIPPDVPSRRNKTFNKINNQQNFVKMNDYSKVDTLTLRIK